MDVEWKQPREKRASPWREIKQQALGASLLVADQSANARKGERSTKGFSILGGTMNVKPGDLAIVVSAPRTPEMIGRIVKVERAAIDGEFFSDVRYCSDGAAAWVCSVDARSGPLPSRTKNGVLLWLRTRAIADRLLRPISGLPLNDNIETEKLIEELA
jgi:hypothetical protein